MLKNVEIRMRKRNYVIGFSNFQVNISIGFDSQPEGLGVAFFATGPGLGLIMYILTTLEFPTHNNDFHPGRRDENNHMNAREIYPA